MTKKLFKKIVHWVDTALAEELTCVYNIMNKILNMCLDVLEFEIQNKQKNV